MMNLSSEVLARLAGKTLVTAESLTGGGIGAALTAVPGASAVYRGGIICYTNEVKAEVLGVEPEILERFGAVSSKTAAQMAQGARKVLRGDVALAVTGLAGPGGDEFGHPVGTVFIGYADRHTLQVTENHFTGTRQQIREQTIKKALELALEHNP